MMDLSGKMGVVTGVSSLIGRSVAISLAEAGLAVACLSTSQEESELTASIIVNNGGSALAFSHFPGELDSINSAIENACENMGSPSVVCNTEEFGRYSHTTDQDPEVLNKIIQTNFATPLLVAKIVLPHLLSTGGSMINVVSSAGLRPVPYAAAYSGSQAAVVMMTKSLALEYLERGVRVNAVAVSGVDSVFTPEKGFPAGMAAKWLEQMKSPLGEVDPRAIGDIVKFLISEEARYITGAVIAVDGGVSIK